jgi:hypothetical protein
LARREVDENNMPLYTTPMDNILASVVALANIDPTADNTLEIGYAKNLLSKCIQQLRDVWDSHGRVYSHSSVSRAASTGNHAIVAAIAALAANLQNCPPLLGTYSRRRSRKANCGTTNLSTPPTSRRIISAKPTTADMWGPRLTIRNSRYAYNSRSQETVVNPHNIVGITDTSSIT